MRFDDIAHDAARRFAALISLAERLELPSDAAVLDVGGYPGTLGRLLRERFGRWNVLTSDVVEAELEGYVQTSGGRLPFDDGEFDAVFTSDVLEHVPSDVRSKFLAEVCRVSRNVVFVGAPFAHPIVANAERELNDFHLQKFGKPHPWLSEHVEYGLPELDKVLEVFPEDRAQAVFQSTPLQDWLIWHWSYLAVAGSEKLDAAWDEANHAWNESLDEKLKAHCVELEQVKAASVQSFMPYRYIIVSQPKADAKFEAFPVGQKPLNVPGSTSLFALSKWLMMMVSGASDRQSGGGADVINKRLTQALELAEADNKQMRNEPNAPRLSLLRRLLGR